MPDATAAITLRNLTYELGDACLMQVETLDVPRNGVSVILGPNGAGKSVLLRMIHGILPPTGGDVSFPAFGASPRQAMVFQKPVLLRRSVAANILFALDAARQPRSRLGVLLDLAHLADRARQPARALSGGEQQRLAMVRALATAPDILFLDEPSANLDPASTLALEALIGTARDDGIKVVMVTHDVAQARRMADHVVYCHGGHILAEGAPDMLSGTGACPELNDFLSGNLRP